MVLHYFNINFVSTIEFLWIPACILLSCLTAGVLLNRFINRRLQEKYGSDPESLSYVFTNAIKGLPISWSIGVGLYMTITTIQMPERLLDFLSNILLGVILFTITRVAARTLVGMIDMHTQKNGSNLPKTSLLTNIVNIAIYVIGILIIMQSYGISITPIITALGVGGAAVALGLQETLANIFSGLHLILSKQIRLGDYIKLSSGEEGCVTDITWRFTMIQGLSNNVVVVPNQKIASAILTNYSMPKQDVSISIPIGVSYDSDLDHVERVTLEVADEIMQKFDHAHALKAAVRFHTFGESSINFNVSLHSNQFLNQFPLKHEFIKALTKRYREEGIEIPYPVHTIIKKDEA
ncbi:mechanosensitive ion channel family protein [Anaerosinus massiliensis]|uniref:mechanosensitive ion channel family protein n=1 Tax=Massilibacillus massiliensis TaxID=1806837 RepID=UPI000DA60775|nr:mechanosensitive ion channel family protein [Massilibacillus massiliensis]